MHELNLTLDTTTVNLNPEPKVDYPPRQLLTPLPTPGHFLLVIDNSSLEVFTTCPKSSDYKLVRRREAHARNAALTFGGAIHEGLESLLLGQSPDEQDSIINKFFTENPAPLDEYRTLLNALTVMKAYRVRASLPDYEWSIQQDMNGPIVERAFELPLGVLEVNAEIPGFGHVLQIHVAWSGRIDVVANCQNMNRVVDHKTTSIAGDTFVQDFQISNPVLGYVWAGRQLWPDLDISGFCLNAIHFKKPTGSGPIDMPGPRGGPPALNFFRAHFDYSPQRIDQWAENCLTIVSDFVHCLVRNSFPRHTKWCFGKYGKCQYHDVCVQDSPTVRANMLNSDMFRPVTWNPVAGR